MAPRAQRYSLDYPFGVETTKEPTLKWDTVKYLFGMLLAGIVSYYATLYGLREEIAVLKVRVEFLMKQVDSQTQAIHALTGAITAHTAAHQVPATKRR